jgi:hypothetical protein
VLGGAGVLHADDPYAMDDDNEPERIQLHCSWCHRLCTQVMTERNVLIRSVYSCSHCQECVPSPSRASLDFGTMRHRPFHLTAPHTRVFACAGVRCCAKTRCARAPPKVASSGTMTCAQFAMEPSTAGPGRTQVRFPVLPGAQLF